MSYGPWAIGQHGATGWSGLGKAWPEKMLYGLMVCGLGPRLGVFSFLSFR